MSKLKNCGRIIVLFALVVALTVGVFFSTGNVRVYAAKDETVIDIPVEQESDFDVAPPADTTPNDTEIEPSQGNVGNSDEVAEGNLDLLMEAFLARLKAKYGDDYETYYNAILAEWGSVEEYLLSLAGDNDDPTANGWRAFVSWLGENSPIWASALAIVFIVILVICGKKALDKLFSWLTAKKKVIFRGMNKVYEAQLAQSQALLKLLGNNPNTVAERDNLIKAMETLQEEDVDDD